MRADPFRPRDACGGTAEDVLPAVHLNDVYQRDVTALHGLATEVVRDVQLVRPIDTALRFGRAHPPGALIVRRQLRRRGDRARRAVGYGAAKGHLSFYIMHGEVLRRHAAQLAAYDVSRTVVRFTPDRPLPGALVRTLVTARLREIAEGS